MLGASELNVSASGVAEGVFTFVLVKLIGAATTRGGSWSQGGPSAEAATCGAEEALQRRTRRTHCGRPCDSLGAMGYYHPRSWSGYVSVVWAVRHRRGESMA